MIRLLIFLAVCASAIAQPLTVNDTAFVGSLTVGSSPSTFYPSNIATMVSQWIVDNAQTNTSSQITNLPDSGANAFNLTNTAAGTMPRLTNNILNGHAIAAFDGSNNHLECTSYTNTQPHEIWMFAYYNDAGGTGPKYYFDSCTAEYRQSALGKSGSGVPFSIRGTNSLDTTIYATNFNFRWIVWTCVFNGANSEILSNNVAVTSGNAGSDTMSGFTIGSAFNNTANLKVWFTELFTFSATNSGSDRAKCFTYLTNKYGAL